MRNPCINCPDRKDSVSDCEGPHCWEKREAYLRHIQNDGTYFDGVKLVDGSRLTVDSSRLPVDGCRLTVDSKKENPVLNSPFKKGDQGGCMDMKNKDSRGQGFEGSSGEIKETGPMRACKACEIDYSADGCKGCEKLNKHNWYLNSKKKKAKEKPNVPVPPAPAGQTTQNKDKCLARNNANNKLLDLNNHLFEQLRRLDNDKLNGEKLTEEIARAKAVSGIASQIITNAKVSLDAMIAINDARIQSTPEMIGMSYEDEKE